MFLLSETGYAWIFYNKRKSLSILLVLQNVADLGQQNFFLGRSGGSGRLCSCGFFFLLLAQLGQLVEALDDEEYYQRQNEEVNDSEIKLP